MVSREYVLEKDKQIQHNGVFLASSILQAINKGGCYIFAYLLLSWNRGTNHLLTTLIF